MKEIWDDRFASDSYLYGMEPNPQFKEFIDKLPVGTLFLPGEGEGRNAVYAAQKGHNVLAIDQSIEGKRKALQLAAKHSVHFEYLNTNLFDPKLAAPQFDAAALVFLHLPPHIRHTYHQFVTQSLKPNGKLFVVGFSIDQLPLSSGGPKDPTWLYTTQLLTNDFPHLTIVSNQQIECVLNEGTGHQGKASLVVMEGVKPEFGD